MVHSGNGTAGRMFSYHVNSTDNWLMWCKYIGYIH